MNQIILNTSENFVEGIRVTNRPIDTDMGVRPLTPFTLSISAETSNYEDLDVTLYANNSKSIPYTSELSNSYSPLKPQWKFTTATGTPIEETIDIDYHTEVVDENGIVRGGIGSITFYYTDDLPSDCGVPVMLMASVNINKYHDRAGRGFGMGVESYYNSEMQVIMPFVVYPIKPSFLHFSQNGEVELPPMQWGGVDMKAYATIHGIPRLQFQDPAMCGGAYPIIFNSPKYDSVSGMNILEYTISPLTSDEMMPSGSAWPPSGEFLPIEMRSGVANGGWTEVHATPLVTSESAALTGKMTVRYDEADYYCNKPSYTSRHFVSIYKILY